LLYNRFSGFFLPVYSLFIPCLFPVYSLFIPCLFPVYSSKYTFTWKNMPTFPAEKMVGKRVVEINGWKKIVFGRSWVEKSWIDK